MTSLLLRHPRIVGLLTALGLSALGPSGCADTFKTDDRATDTPSSAGASGAGGSSGMGGSSGDAGTGGTGPGCAGETCACPSYQSLCGGKCILTSNDPANCGGCGVTCAEGTLCSSGACESTCSYDLAACNGACLDVSLDSQNCGACGNVCEVGQSCVSGICRKSTLISPAKCEGGGPPIVVATGKQSACTGELAQASFAKALCSCSDFRITNSFLVDSFDSSKGAYKPGTGGAQIGVNRQLSISNTMDVWGSLRASSPEGSKINNPLTVREDLYWAGAFSASNKVQVHGDAWIGGDVKGSLTVGGTLHVPDERVIAASVTHGSLSREAVNVDTPCDCDEEKLIPVASIVAAHKTQNDNTLIGLDPALLVKAHSEDFLELPCGNYYLDAISLNTPFTIVVRGRTALYIDGDVSASAGLTVAIAPGATLDVFIAGTLKASSGITIGSLSYPALTRIYVGSAEDISFSSGATLAANLYAPKAQVTASSGMTAYGALFVGKFTSHGGTSIHHDSLVSSLSEPCAN